MTERKRYARQILLPEVGESGQDVLAGASVTIVGVGGLGSPAAMYLAAAGVGNIRLIDPDPVELSNLNRQLLHHQEDYETSRAKVESAKMKLRSLNPEITVEGVRERLDLKNAARLVQKPNVVLDCLDNYDARHDLNRYCVTNGLKLVHAAVEGWRGQMTTIFPGKTCCISCLVPRSPKREGPIPIIGAVAGTFGCMEANEAIKTILGLPGVLQGRLLIGDLLEQSWETIDVERNPHCPVCKGI
ncbi:MAG: putative adenylyltransferase [Methanomassiliicoccales archaeon PtaU1.Bin124]|nr:MAG: putative adenylyltransferase [Methanomassiliicoccales archaeon PtaU1.Bin124]